MTSKNCCSHGFGDYKICEWSEGLRFVQFMKNRSLHANIKRNPYKAMFGIPFWISMENISLSGEVRGGSGGVCDLEKALTSLHDELRDSKVEEIPSQQLNSGASYKEGPISYVNCTSLVIQ